MTGRAPGRIGLYGAMANNTYCLARAMRARGEQAFYLHDSRDTFPMSQPVWEDAELTIDPARVFELTREDWRRLAAEVGWRAPAWLEELPLEKGIPHRSVPRMLRMAAALPPARYREFAGYLRANARLIDRLAGFDWLVVCGVGVIDAYLSGTPYLYWPHGGELRVLPNRDANAHDRFLADAMRIAVARADATGTSDATLAEELERVGGRLDAEFLTFVVDTDRYAPGPAGPVGDELRGRAGDRLILFMPSRQDFRWKGTDRFVRAFIRASKEGAPLFLVLSPWGRDSAAVRSMLSEAGLSEAFHVLPELPSKPLLIKLYRAADVVVDQFVIGAYGTTMMEAMACATPVLTSLDDSLSSRRWQDYTAPPVIRATGEDEIREALLRLDRARLPAIGQASREWALRVHGLEATSRFLPRC